jgi:molybdate transport system permease protein
MDRRTTPIPMVVLASVGIAFLTVPLLALLIRAPWGSIIERLSTSGAWVALRLSLVVSLSAAAISFVLGVPIAWVLARARFRGRALVRAVVILPLVLPPVVGGVALLTSLGRSGIVGRWLYELGIQVTFTTTGAIIATTFVSIPLMVLSAEGGFRSLDVRLEEAAAAMGASRGTVLRRVTLPLIRPQLAAGLILAWARALGEFGATITFAGNLAGRTQTLPLAVYQVRQSDPDAAVATSLLLVALSLIVLVGMRDRIFGR